MQELHPLPKGFSGTVQRGPYAGQPYTVLGLRQEYAYTVKINGTLHPSGLPLSLLVPKLQKP